MTVTCKVVYCPYHGNDNFCTRGTVSIDDNGMCAVVWKNGVQRNLYQPFNDINYPKHPIEVIDGQWVAVDVGCQQKETRLEESESEVPAFEQKVEENINEKEGIQKNGEEDNGKDDE